LEIRSTKRVNNLRNTGGGESARGEDSWDTEAEQKSKGGNNAFQESSSHSFHRGLNDVRGLSLPLTYSRGREGGGRRKNIGELKRGPALIQSGAAISTGVARRKNEKVNLALLRGETKT